MRARAQDGVTLVELLVAVTLIGIVVPAIAGAFVVGFRTFADTGDRVTESSSAEIATAYWGADVMNATAIVLPSSPDPDCRPAGTARVVSFAVGETSTTWYVTSGPALVRRECATRTDTTIASALIATDLPTAVCAPSNCTRVVTLTLPQAGVDGAGHFVTSLTGMRRNPDADA